MRKVQRKNQRSHLAFIPYDLILDCCLDAIHRVFTSLNDPNKISTLRKKRNLCTLLFLSSRVIKSRNTFWRYIRGMLQTYTHNVTQYGKYFNAIYAVYIFCRCKGTLAYVHLSCLERWLNQSCRTYCELCRYYFNAVETPRYRWWALYLPDKNTGNDAFRKPDVIRAPEMDFLFRFPSPRLLFSFPRWIARELVIFFSIFLRAIYFLAPSWSGCSLELTWVSKMMHRVNYSRNRDKSAALLVLIYALK